MTATHLIMFFMGGIPTPSAKPTGLGIRRYACVGVLRDYVRGVFS